MARHGVTAPRAFDLLARRSAESRRKLRDVAADLVDEVQHPGRTPEAVRGDEESGPGR